MSYNYYSEEEDYGQKESINNYLKIFSQYVKEMPSLSDALYQIFKSSNLDDNKIKSLTEDIMKKCGIIYEQNLNKINQKYPNISKDEALILCSYTCESKEYEYSPFILLHKNLVVENRKQGLENVSKYLYIFLRALKKLPVVQLHQKLYKFIQREIKINEDDSNKNIIPYQKGITKTFWGFTSVNLSQNIEYGEMKDDNDSEKNTLFIIEGENCGYDISLFNYHWREKYLLEPEIEYTINNIIPNIRDMIFVSCKIIKSSNLFENINIEEQISIINESLTKKDIIWYIFSKNK